MKKQNKGITLIALIITIVVMLILVGIVVSTTINSNLINKVKRAKGEWERAEGEDSNLSGATINGEYYGSLQDYVTQLGSVSAYGVDSIIDDGLIYRKTSDTEVAVVGILDKSAVKANIKSTIEFEGKRYTVTSIGTSAFSSCSNLTSITIPNTITAGGMLAFLNCTSLTEVELLEGVTSVAPGMFLGCSSLTNIVIPNSVTIIDYYAFSGCTSLTSITIPNSVTNISNIAFAACSMVYYAPACTSLTSINVAEGNANYSSEDGVLYNKEKTELILCLPGKTGTLEIAEGVTSISSVAFSGCSGLTSITVAEENANYSSEDGVLYNKDKTQLIVCPAGKTGTLEIAEGVTNVSNSMIANCSGLTGIIIPAGVSYLDAWMFGSCTSLMSITVAEGNTNYSSLDGVLYNKDKTQLMVCPRGKTGNLEFAEGVTSIGYSAFNGCSGLTSITVADGNANYSSLDGVLYNKDRTQLIVCPAGKTGTVEIPDSVTGMNSGAFAGCGSLTSISVKDAAQKQLVMMDSMSGVDENIIIQRDLQS